MGLWTVQPATHLIADWSDSMTTPSPELYREIPLTRGLVAIVDADLFGWLSQWKWKAERNKSGQWYARRLERGPAPRRHVYMHREVLGLSPDDPRMPDHIDPKLTLFNVRSNLRIATKSQNGANKAVSAKNKLGIKGVHLKRGKPGWRDRFVAQIKVAGKVKFLGHYDTPEEAHAAYCQAAKEAFGEFARFS
jgi:hypothetical protein